MMMIWHILGLTGAAVLTSLLVLQVMVGWTPCSGLAAGGEA